MFKRVVSKEDAQEYLERYNKLSAKLADARAEIDEIKALPAAKRKAKFRQALLEELNQYISLVEAELGDPCIRATEARRAMAALLGGEIRHCEEAIQYFADQMQIGSLTQAATWALDKALQGEAQKELVVRLADALAKTPVRDWLPAIESWKKDVLTASRYGLDNITLDGRGLSKQAKSKAHLELVVGSFATELEFTVRYLARNILVEDWDV